VNLRGQVVSTMDLGLRMGLGRSGVDAAPAMSVVVRWQDEVWSLLVDRVGDVIEVRDEQFEPPPETLTGALRDVILGAYKLENSLLLLLDLQQLLKVGAQAPAR
jgi:purine-binding chemotaxis protein CheW